MPTSRNVLIFGRESMLLQTRRLILEHAGFTVETVEEPGDIKVALSGASFGLLIICQSMSDEEGKAAIELAYQLHPDIKSLVMALTRQSLMEGPNETALSPSAGPQMFLQTVHRLLGDLHQSAT